MKRKNRVTRTTLREAEKLALLNFNKQERRGILSKIHEIIELYRKRHNIDLPNALSPALTFSVHTTEREMPEQSKIVLGDVEVPPLPQQDEGIAFAPVTHLARWIETGKLSSVHLTKLYLDRLKEYGPALECIITLSEKRAFEQAERADEEISRGKYRGPLHGIPWGAKDLFDTAGIPTTWGAAPFRDRVPNSDAGVVRLLDEAGAVLTAKLSMGALAFGDVWFGGRTRNPWKIEQPSSGSSAGSAAAVATGLVGFSLGTETCGSIVNPCNRCGVTGLRPTFGRVPRTGTMALSWSYDKIGPICRRIEDTVLVLDAINSFDVMDPDSIKANIYFDANKSLDNLRVGFLPKLFDKEKATNVERNTLDLLAQFSVQLQEIELPGLPYELLWTLIKVDAAAAFEELTLSDRDDELRWQALEAWPNIFRVHRFVPAVEYVQIQRFRRHVIHLMDDIFNGLDALIAPGFVGELDIITNSTGHPALAMPAGFNDDGTPLGVTLYGRPFDEGTLCRLGLALERELEIYKHRPRLVGNEIAIQSKSVTSD